MFRYILWALGACLLASVVCAFGWFVSRANGRPDVAIHFAGVLKWSLYVMAAAAIYSAAVGVYHTFLSVTGLDGGDGDGDGDRDGGREGGDEGGGGGTGGTPGGTPD